MLPISSGYWIIAILEDTHSNSHKMLRPFFMIIHFSLGNGQHSFKVMNEIIGLHDLR